MRLDRKRVVLTGASSGIGEALAEALAAKGSRLLLAARRLDRLENLATIIGLGVPALPPPQAFRCDVTDRDSVRQLCAAACERLGGIDVVINNAGISVYGETERAAVTDFDTVMAVNFFGPLYVMLEALPIMRRQGGGLIVNVASVAALHGVPYLGAYSASKAALVALTQSLRAELHGSGVRFLTVYPGYTRTPLFDHEKQLGGARRPTTGYAAARDVARAMVRAIEAGREELVLSSTGRALSLVRGILPRVVAQVMRRVAAQLRDPQQVRYA